MLAGETVAEDAWGIGDLRHAESPDCLHAMLLFLRCIIISIVLLNNGRLQGALHLLKILRDRVVIQLHGNDLEEILVSLDSKSVRCVRSEQHLHQLHGLLGWDLNLL